MPVTFIETIQVKEGVECDTYSFANDHTKDLAIVKVTKGHKTPLQKVLKGNKTVEGFLEGRGRLVVNSGKNKESYEFDNASKPKEIIVEVDQIMQWTASGETDLVFYEICEPPYEDGRFENLADQTI